MLETLLTQPEEIVIQQGTYGTYLYFIAQGDCILNVMALDDFEHVAYKLLNEGNHFGEISLVYGCRAQATVMSRNYNTLAIISKA